MRTESGTLSTAFLFTGEQRDGDSELYYLRARYYDPSIGRLLTRDPFAGFVVSPQSLNRYPYSVNDPINLVDPWGLCGFRGFGDFADCFNPENVGGGFKKVGGAFGEVFGDPRVWRPLAGAALIIVADIPATVLHVACIASGGAACPLAAWYDVAVAIPATYMGLCLITGENFFGIPVPGLDEFCRAGEEPKGDKE